MDIGSQPIDDGNFILNDEQRADLLADEPGAVKFLRPYIGARELIQGQRRWVLALMDAEPSELRAMPHIVERLRNVRAFRAKSRRKSTLAIADAPAVWNLTVIPSEPFLVVPRVSSERRAYVPIEWAEPPTVPSDAVLVVLKATLIDFAFLASAMHTAWLRYMGGRLKSDYRYSKAVVYNNFPIPSNEAEQSHLDPLARAVLDARAAHPASTLADLYAPDLMPADLRRAHRALDRAVDRLYRPRPFSSERDRVEHLFTLYERLRAPLTAATKKKPKRRRTVRLSPR